MANGYPDFNKGEEKMTISELIAELEFYKEHYGNLEVSLNVYYNELQSEMFDVRTPYEPEEEEYHIIEDRLIIG